MLPALHEFPRAFWLVPAAMLILALANWPYVYYVFLRIVVFICTAILALKEQDERSTPWALLMLGLAILFNPFAPVHLTRSIWAFVDVAAAGALIAHMIFRREKRSNA